MMPAAPGARVAGRSMNREPQAARALSEAWDWLYLQGLISPDPSENGDRYFVTRRGQRVLADASLLEEEW